MDESLSSFLSDPRDDKFHWWHCLCYPVRKQPVLRYWGEIGGIVAGGIKGGVGTSGDI
jgi:hypothetical protein